MFKSRRNNDNDRDHVTKSNDSKKDNLPNKYTCNKIDINKNKNEQSQKNNNIVPNIYDKRKLQPFTGIQNLIQLDDMDKNESPKNVNYIIEDDDNDVYTEVAAPKPMETVKDIETMVCGALSSLMCDYGSSDEESKPESLNGNVRTTSKTIHTRNVKNVTIHSEHKINLVVKVSKDGLSGAPSSSLNDDDSGPEEVKILKRGITVENEVNKTLETANNKDVRRNKKKQIVQKKHIQNRPKPKVPSTLLQKLLHMEIRHERNVVLQCIRYIVNNNYFDKKIENII